MTLANVESEAKPDEQRPPAAAPSGAALQEDDVVEHGNAKARIKGAGFGGQRDWADYPFPP